MKTIYEQREELEGKAIEYLKATVYSDDPSECPEYLTLFLSADERSIMREEYDNNLKIFKALYNADDPQMKIALWNAIMPQSNRRLPYKKDYTDDEYSFLKTVRKAKATSFEETNLNKPIKSDRLILRKIKKSDFDVFAYHFEHDGDFEAYTGREPSAYMIRSYANRRSHALFAVVEKTTHVVIGCAGLDIRDDLADGLLDYYIFKPYRKQGYAKEAITALVNAALKNELYVPTETLQECTFGKTKVRFDTVRAKIAPTNIPSIKTVQSCGFVREDGIDELLLTDGVEPPDEDMYYLPTDK